MPSAVKLICYATPQDVIRSNKQAWTLSNTETPHRWCRQGPRLQLIQFSYTLSKIWLFRRGIITIQAQMSTSVWPSLTLQLKGKGLCNNRLYKQTLVMKAWRGTPYRAESHYGVLHHQQTTGQDIAMLTWFNLHREYLLRTALGQRQPPVCISYYISNGRFKL